jgi:hypothetical protein
MAVTEPLPFNAEELAGAIGDVLSTMGEPEHVAIEGLTERPYFMARVVITGEGAVELIVAAPTSVVAALASIFFGEVTEEADLFDAMGELANQFGGSIKPYLEGTWVIGIPERHDPTMTATEHIIEANAAFGSGLVTVAVAPLDVDALAGTGGMGMG